MGGQAGQLGTMEGKGGPRERSKMGCMGEMLIRQMQKARCCSSSDCPHIHPSRRGSSRSSNPAMIFPSPDPFIHIHFLSLYVSIYPPARIILSPFPSIHPSTPRHHYLLPNTTHPPPCTHPASPPSPCPHHIGKRKGATLGVWALPGPPGWVAWPLLCRLLSQLSQG